MFFQATLFCTMCRMPVLLLPTLNPLPLPSLPRPFDMAKLPSVMTGTSCEM
ncbi:hypothetical protein SCE1572_06370 [Sorangium cellulosum So0157-2]|uniref:Uncharacterized protein n=1 Tax=Sorangium cellulosum So0157-2 TaxID=1254432 RepID=S4XQN2_SORCE|nr:hypothetical protein SCE1572_06370 [Sorangium cellulosum So0157-2]